MAADRDRALTDLARDHSGQVLALLARRFNDLDLADDAVQEALIEAAERWRTDEPPENPAGWLYRVALRKAIDRTRRQGAEQRRLQRHGPDLAQGDEQSNPATETRTTMIDDDDTLEMGDERLRLILLCCHPALAKEAQIALTLRLVAGLTTDEIAAAFLVQTSTMAARITRAKKKIRAANIPLAMPKQLAERLDAVLAVIYLIFNEGYLSRSADQPSLRVDLCEEAIRLAAVVAELTGGDANESALQARAEAEGLVALLAFTHARRDSRFQGDTLVLLEDQDRRRWHLDEIEYANRVMSSAMQRMAPGPYQLEALIASYHCAARDAAETDWSKIVALYSQLAAMRPTPVVALNRAVAVAMADGPLAGLRELDKIEGLDDYHLAHAARGELFLRAGDHESARVWFDQALTLATNSAERAHLQRRLDSLN